MMIEHLEVSIKQFRERRMLIIPWLLALLFGIFANLFASALFGEFEYSNWGFALVFLIISCFFAGLVFWFFPPKFEHVFQVWFGEAALEGKLKLFKRFGTLENQDKLEDFFRVYHSLMVRDILKEHHMRLTKVIDVKIAEYGYETWIFVRLDPKVSWLQRSLEEKVRDELILLCEAFATTIQPFLWIDEGTPTEQVKAFDIALQNIRFENTKAKVQQQIIEATAAR